MAPVPLVTAEERLTWEERMVRDTVAVERDRCARIAEEYSAHEPQRALAMTIATRIRSGK